MSRGTCLSLSLLVLAGCASPWLSVSESDWRTVPPAEREAVDGASAPDCMPYSKQVPVAQIAPIMPYLLLVLILAFRPMGLLGTRET